jgi:hypothetical protein
MFCVLRPLHHLYQLSFRTLVKHFLVDYVICVRPNHRLLYSDRLHVYGKDRSYVTTHFNKLFTDFEVFVPLEQVGLDLML